MAEKFSESSKSFNEKIDDFCAEFGVSRNDISVDETLGPNEFIVNSGHDEITVVILAEDEIHDYALYLAAETLFDSFGFVEKAPEEADTVVDLDKMREILDTYYHKEAANLAKIPDGEYPNQLARSCVAAEAISDDDLDRYFNQDGAWLDEQAEDDLCNAYADAKTDENINHSVTWMNDNWDPNSGFWQDLGRKSATDVRDILDRRQLIDKEKAAGTALAWNLRTGRCKSEREFISKYAGEMRPAGEYLAFCDDWDRIRFSGSSSDSDDSYLE